MSKPTKYKVTEAIALTGLETFAQYMGIHLPEKSDEKSFSMLEKVVEHVRRGHFEIDEKGVGTYKFQRDAPQALGKSVSFREPTGGDARVMAKADSMPVYVYTASIISHDEELIYLCKQQDSNALTDIGMLVLGG